MSAILDLDDDGQPIGWLFWGELNVRRLGRSKGRNLIPLFNRLAAVFRSSFEQN